MGHIVAIGGGDLRTLATEPIDREIIRLTGRGQPHALFVPTASSDSVEYWQTFNRAYGTNYGCTTDVLYLLGSTPDPRVVAEKIDRADIVYAGGGNALKMMRRWRRLGVDRLMRAAFERGAVLCGVSAGAICWFEQGHSDSMVLYHADPWSYIAVTGLGLIGGLACPHYNGHTDGVSRRRDFQAMLKRKRSRGLAIDNDCAVVFTAGGGFRVVTTKSNVGAYALAVHRGQVIERKLPESADALPIETLYGRPAGPP